MALAQGVATLAVRDCKSTAGCMFSPPVSRLRDDSFEISVSPDPMSGQTMMRERLWARDDSFERNVPPDPMADQKMMRERLWQEFFTDPSQWWDHRSEKVNPRYPDFKHKRTGVGLWLDNNFNPPWVEAELATMAPGLLEPHLFSWHVRLRRHLKSENYAKTLDLFQQMQRNGMKPDKFTFVSVLNACSNLRSLEEGRRVHAQIIQRGCESDIYVATCLVDMYAKCGSIEDAWSVFNKMRERNVVSWNAMIGGYVKSELGLKALELFQKMQQGGVDPDAVTFVAALNACASLVALDEGRRVHKQIIERSCQSDVYVTTSLVDMYAKCGSIEDAWSVFNKMRQRDAVSWNTMIEGYAMHGHPKKAIALFKRMDKEVIEIDEMTFTSLLSACNHGGLVKEGLRYFSTMTSNYIRLPTREHYASMVYLLGRAGRLEEAEEMTKKMPMERNSCLWRSLLSACMIYGNIEIAERAAKMCWELDPENASAPVLLSNIYAAAGKLDRCAATEQDRLKRKVWRELGQTWIKVNNMVHSFVADEKEHSQLLQIYAELEILSVQMNEAGYISDE